MIQDILNGLNPQQQEAVKCTDGPSLIIAGAGSGKTRVLTYKIAYLLACGVQPYHILALTFTNKAAREMRSRIATLVGDEKTRLLRMGTFHSIFAHILRQEAQSIGFTKDYTIYDTQDSKSLIKAIVKQMQLDEKTYKPSVVLSRISLAKNHLMTPLLYSRNKEFTDSDRLARLYRLPEVYATYQQQLKAANAMDFDDLLLNTYQLFTFNQEAREKYQRIFEYILVDEYQDTNSVQYQIIRLLAEPQQNICVVGDDAQSIYSFRGANIENILSFQRDYEQAQLFKLERNYRSTQNIVNAANSIISRNQRQIRKTVYSENDIGQKIEYYSAPSDKEEARYVVSHISRLSKRLPLNEFAILYRTNAQSRVFEDELRRQHLAYRIYGGLAFYQRKEIKDALAYIRLAVNTNDNESLRRIINYPTRGIGDTTLKKLTDAANTYGVPIFTVLLNPAQYGLRLAAATGQRLLSFAQLILSFREQSETLGAYKFIEDVLNRSALLAEARLDLTTEGQDRLQNLMELLNSVRDWEETNTVETDANLSPTPAVETPSLSISQFLEEVALMTDQDEKQKDHEQRVTLMTVHAAKGLEFAVVFVTGMEEKLFPSTFAESERELEEERRLFYVALTRAKEQCFLSSAKSRFRNGEMQFSAESRFIHEINHHYLTTSRQTSTPQTYSAPRAIETPAVETDANLSHTYHTSHTTHTYPTTHTSHISPLSSADSPRTPSTSPFKPQMRVMHSKFGKGTVIEAYIENGNDKVVVRFDTEGQKTLLLKFAQLQMI